MKLNPQWLTPCQQSWKAALQFCTWLSSIIQVCRTVVGWRPQRAWSSPGAVGRKEAGIALHPRWGVLAKYAELAWEIIDVLVDFFYLSWNLHKMSMCFCQLRFSAFLFCVLSQVTQSLLDKLTILDNIFFLVFLMYQMYITYGPNF